MPNPILAKESETIFLDKFDSLTLKDIAIELKHYRIGTAPEKPSFVANQEEAKKKIIEKFKDFFSISTGIELPILISNIGDGKTHFIRMIADAFSDIPNVRIRRIYVRDEQVDIKFKILEAVERSEVKSCVCKTLGEFVNKKVYNECEIIAFLQDKYDINKNLATILLRCISDDIRIQTQAIQLLKGNIDYNFIEEQQLYDFMSSSEEFYFGFLKILCSYLENENLYIIIVFDEIEHVMDWKDSEKQKRFFRNIKEFTDKMMSYQNLFLILAATQIYKGNDVIQQINLIEPATYDRMKSLFIKLKDIESDEEVMNLIKYLKKRYEKFYCISLDENLVLEKLKNRFSTQKVETTYRNYAQEIIKIFDWYKEQHTIDKNEIKTNVKAENKDNISDKKKQLEKMWNNTSSPMANKSMLVEAVGALVHLRGKKLVDVKRRTGYLTALGDDNQKQLYYIVYTTKLDSDSLFNEKLQEAISIRKRLNIDAFTFLFPEKLISEKDKKNIIKKVKANFVSYNYEQIINLLVLLDKQISLEDKKEIANHIKMVV